MEETQANGNGKAIVMAARSVQMAAYEPRNSTEAYQMAAWFAKSKLLPGIEAAEQAFLVMATGADLGIPATTALRCISIVKGKPVLAADLMKAMCISRKDVCEKFMLIKSDEKIATYTVKRVGDEPVTMSFSMDDAVRAKLATKGDDSNYGKYPAAMLRHRAVATIAREVFPDVVLGVYCEEEADEIRAAVVEAEAGQVDAAAVDSLEMRVKEFGAAIEGCTTLEHLKAVNEKIDEDPAKETIKIRLRDFYNVKRAAIAAVANGQ